MQKFIFRKRPFTLHYLHCSILVTSAFCFDSTICFTDTILFLIFSIKQSLFYSYIILNITKLLLNISSRSVLWSIVMSTFSNKFENLWKPFSIGNWCRSYFVRNTILISLWPVEFHYWSSSQTFVGDSIEMNVNCNVIYFIHVIICILWK